MPSSRRHRCIQGSGYVERVEIDQIVSVDIERRHKVLYAVAITFDHGPGKANNCRRTCLDTGNSISAYLGVIDRDFERITLSATLPPGSSADPPQFHDLR